MAFKKFFTLSFDDGTEYDKRFIELMKQYGLSGTFNLSAGMLGKHHKLARISHIPKDEIKQVYEGFEVASHGYRHEMFRYMSKKKIEKSLVTDIDELSEIMGYKIAGHAYPYDMHTRSAEEILRSQNILYARKALGKGKLFSFGENPHKYIATCAFNSKKINEMIDLFIKARPTDENLLFTMWGHSFEMKIGFRPCPENRLEELFAKIAGHSDIVYCTSKEAFEQNSICV